MNGYTVGSTRRIMGQDFRKCSIPDTMLRRGRLLALLRGHNSLAFTHRIDCVQRRRRNHFDSPARPTYFDLLDFGRGAQTEVRTRVRARRKTSTGHHISALRETIRRHIYLRAHRISWAATLAGSMGRIADQMKSNP